MEKEKKKKGFFAALWESMTKTGGCCGGGQNCGCGPSSQDNTKVSEKRAEESKKKNESIRRQVAGRETLL